MDVLGAGHTERAAALERSKQKVRSFMMKCEDEIALLDRRGREEMQMLDSFSGVPQSNAGRETSPNLKGKSIASNTVPSYIFPSFPDLPLSSLQKCSADAVALCIVTSDRI